MIRRIAVVALACGAVVLAGVSPARARGFSAVFTQDGIDVWAVGDTGTVYRSTSSGADYISQSVGGNAPLRGVAANGIVALMVGDAGVVWRSTDSGGSWASQTLPAAPNLSGVAFPDPAAAYVVGAGGAIFKSVDGGASWAAQTSGTAAALWGVRFLDANNGWAVGDNGTVLATHDGGANWSPASIGTTNRFRAIDQSGLTVWAVGDRGTCWRSLNGGTAWTPVNLKLDARSDVRGVRVVTPDTIWIAGGGGFVRRSSNGGSTWTFLQHKMHGALSCLAVFGTKAWMTSSTHQTVFRTQNGGTTWTMPNSASMSLSFVQTFNGPGSVRGSTMALSPTDENTIYCAMMSSLYVSHDAGESFQFLHSFPAGVTKINAFVVSPKDTAGNLRMGALVGGGLSDRFVRSVDGGATWATTLVHDFGEYGIPLEMHPDKPDTLFFGGDADTLMRSTDFGLTWQTACIDSAFRSPCDIVVVPDSGDVILVGDGITGSVTPPGQYYKSTDGGGKFELITTRPGGQFASEIPGMACSRLRNNVTLGTNWSGGGVQRTQDYGSSWPVVNPAAQAWGIDICRDDPNLVVFGVYSGNDIFFTYDGGTSWTNVNTPGISSNYSFYARDRGVILAEQAGGVWKLRPTYTFTPSTAQALNVVAPNGGESWTAGTVHNIRWSQGNVAAVRIEYRLTPSDPWQLIALVNGASGTYAWTVPYVVTDQAAVRVSDGWDASPIDESDAEFTIATALAEATPTPLDFGSVAKGGALTLPVTLSNPGTGILSVTAVTTSNAGFGEGRSTFSLSPGASDTIGVTFRPAAGVSYAGTLDITSNAYGTPVLSVPLTGVGLGPIFAATPDPVEFPDMLAGASAQDTIHIANPGTTPLNITSVTSSNPQFYAGRTAFTIAAGGSDSLSIVYTPWDGGLDTSIVSIVANDTVAAHSITVHGQAHTNNTAVGQAPPTAFTLSQNQPNPFRRGTAIRYALPQAAEVTLEVFNLQGQRVATLVHEFQSPGWYTVPFGATGADGARLAGMTSGVYFYRLHAGSFAHTRKMLFVR